MSCFQFSPIGWLKTPFKDKFGTPRQGYLVPSATATVEWAPGTQPEVWLEGLQGFSHVWLISVFHGHYGQPSPSKIHPPRLGGARVGVLASRSPHRPNPIGLTLARVTRVEDGKLLLSEVDLIDGTPILDLKPYVAEADLAHDVRGGWVEANPWPMLSVSFNVSFEEGLNRVYRLAPPPVPREELKNLIRQTLAADPRAVADRETNQVPDGRPRWFWLRLYDLDFGFHFTINGQIEVVAARFALHSSLYARFENQQEQSQA